jgi:hypothetical protein
VALTAMTLNATARNGGSWTLALQGTTAEIGRASRNLQDYHQKSVERSSSETEAPGTQSMKEPSSCSLRQTESSGAKAVFEAVKRSLMVSGRVVVRQKRPERETSTSSG